jgi:hypothetical protein
MTSAASVACDVSPATIYYLDQDNVNITGGTRNNTYNVQGTEAFFTTNLDTGPGTDTVNVQSTAPFSTFNIDNLYSTSNHDTVNIGSTAPSLGGTLQNIAGTVNVNNTSGGGTALNIDDSGDHTGVGGGVSHIKNITGGHGGAGHEIDDYIAGVGRVIQRIGAAAAIDGATAISSSPAPAPARSSAATARI